MDLEVWAESVIEESGGGITHREFGANLPRIGTLGRRHGFDDLKAALIGGTTAGMPFSTTLMVLERFGAP